MSAPYNRSPETSHPAPAHQQTVPLSTANEQATGGPLTPETTAAPAQPPQTAQATVVGEVRFRMGDGPLRTVPLGPVELTLTATDATLSWTAEDTAQTAALPLHEFTRMLRDGAIKLSDTPASDRTVLRAA